MSTTTDAEIEVPTRGFIEYIGKEKSKGVYPQPLQVRDFVEPTDKQKFGTRFSLWKQYPWKKIKGKVILKLKLAGDLALEPASQGFSFSQQKDFEPVGSMQELMDMFQYASVDPRIQAVYIELGGLTAGYAKLIELKRAMEYFRKSGKKIYGYCNGGSEKEVFASLSFDEFYIPPDSGLDLRGVSGAATFFRGIFDKIGIEPQVQRIGKYKSFGDSFNRTSLSDAQREVISSLLMESSEYWASSVADKLNKTAIEVASLWGETGIKDSFDYAKLGFISGVRYMDQVEDMLRRRYRATPKKSMFGGGMEFNETMLKSDDALDDFDLASDFVRFPRRKSIVTTEMSGVGEQSADAQAEAPTPAKEEEKPKEEDTKAMKEAAKAKAKLDKAEARFKGTYAKFFPAGLYLRKMRKGNRILQGLPMRQAPAGKRVAIINAVGGIGSGKSSGNNLGSDTIIELVRRAKLDKGVRAIVLRVDSPGGSALASDLMWREIRALSREKPVVASMVDVAASGGYYIAMACDEIVAEELTVTGSIGVVTAKFNAEELNNRVGYKVETLSRGRYAEVLSTTRGFTDEEGAYFEEGAKKAYKSFITKAAASRNMTVEDMHERAQGRVWTGRQAYELGLVDHLGGLDKAIAIAASLSDIKLKEKETLRVQTFKTPRMGRFGLPAAASARSVYDDRDVKGAMYMCDDIVAGCNLAGPSSLGMEGLGPLNAMGLGPLAAFILRNSAIGRASSDLVAESVSSQARSQLSPGNVLSSLGRLIQNIIG
jgi:signal peptide peptidase SppA